MRHAHNASDSMRRQCHTMRWFRTCANILLYAHGGVSICAAQIWRFKCDEGIVVCWQLRNIEFCYFQWQGSIHFVECSLQAYFSSYFSQGQKSTSGMHQQYQADFCCKNIFLRYKFFHIFVIKLLKKNAHIARYNQHGDKTSSTWINFSILSMHGEHFVYITVF